MTVIKTRRGRKYRKMRDKVKKAEKPEEFVEIKSEFETEEKETEEKETEGEETEGEEPSEPEVGENVKEEMNRSGYLLVGDVFVKRVHYDVLTANIEQGGSSLLIGETGTGKTSLVSAIAKKQGKELIRVSVNGSTGVEEIIGKYLAKNGSTVWQDGILIRAMRHGHWVIFDEINAALPEILFTLHQLLDHERKVTISEKDGEVVKPHKDFRFFSNMNPPEEYAGTKELNRALLSRFDAVLNIEVVPEVLEMMTLVMHSGISEDTAYRLVSVANTLRKLKKEDKIFYYCSTRDLVQAGKLINGGLDIRVAVDHTIGNKMNTEDIGECTKIFEELGSSREAPAMSFREMAEGIKKLEERAKNAEQSEKKWSEAHGILLVEKNRIWKERSDFEQLLVKKEEAHKKEIDLLKKAFIDGAIAKVQS